MKNSNIDSEQISSCIDFEGKIKKEHNHIIFYSPSDVGVMRNNGRNGARYAPKAILNRLAKLNNHLNEKDRIIVKEVTNQNIELRNFEQARASSIANFSHLYSTATKIHLGGGHDQIYPLLKAIEQNENIKNIIILNIDAHCDTRINASPNSGTPFRDFDSECVKPFHIIQYGLQKYSNSISTLTSLENGSEEKHFIDTIRKRTENFSKGDKNLFGNVPFEITEETAVIFSLDCDGIDGSNMTAVSAVNPDGLPSQYVLGIAKQLNESFPRAVKFYGFYEFNPVYENESLYSTKVIASILYEILRFR